ncbi:MAG: hypothetical protein KA383_12950 [Phycisphaerae bacterium]|nr:hypothetical protein [Phycisphaerae bacterium]
MVYRTWRADIGIAVGLLMACCLPPAVQAATLTPGNLLVSISAAGYSTLSEFTTAGSVVQSVNVPYPVPPRPTTEVLRDMVVTPGGAVAIYNGTTDPYMTRWAPATGVWSHLTHEGWSTSNLTSYGGIAAWHNYVYVTDTATYGEPADVARGIVRFDTANGTASRYLDYLDWIDLNIGFDGKLYALLPNERFLYVLDPLTMATERGFFLGAACRGIAVDADGRIFGASGDGNIYEFDYFGYVTNTLATGLAGGLTDIDVAADGSLVAGSALGWVINSDTSLQSFDGFRAHPYLPTFVSFTTPVPEPGVAAAALFASALMFRRR